MVRRSAPDAGGKGTLEALVSMVKAIILTQSCDMAFRDGKPPDLPQVLLCGFYFKSELSGERARGEYWNEVITGKRPRYHALNRLALPGRDPDFVLIDFREVFTLGFDEVLGLTEAQSPRPRLMPPYREHLSQAFARLFMRVGLPADIPRFEKPGKLP